MGFSDCPSLIETRIFLETDFKMRYLNKENSLSSINTKYEARHNRHKCENGCILACLCISVWLHIVRACGLMPSLLEPHDHRSQCNGWWSEPAPAAIATWSEMEGTNLLQTLVQNLEISMQVLLYKTTISHLHTPAWDCIACGSKYKVRVMVWKRRHGQTVKAFF